MSEKPSPVLMEEAAGMDPLALFGRWFAEAKEAAGPEGIDDASAMALATVSATGAPAVRVVLLRRFDERGFVFFTNYQSRKAEELSADPRAALSIWWPRLYRQVSIEGAVVKVTAEESDAYFHARPLGNRLSAWASTQSRVIPDRAYLDRRMEEVARQYADGNVPRPAHWGGYRVVPNMIEFWQGRDSRVHDRLRYGRQPDGSWRRERLAP